MVLIGRGSKDKDHSQGGLGNNKGSHGRNKGNGDTGKNGLQITIEIAQLDDKSHYYAL